MPPLMSPSKWMAKLNRDAQCRQTAYLKVGNWIPFDARDVLKNRAVEPDDIQGQGMSSSFVIDLATCAEETEALPFSCLAFFWGKVANVASEGKGPDFTAQLRWKIQEPRKVGVLVCAAWT